MLKDVQSGAAVFDHWLREASGGMVTLETIKSVAGALLVIGNVIALVDGHGRCHHAGKDVGYADSGLGQFWHQPLLKTNVAMLRRMAPELRANWRKPS